MIEATLPDGAVVQITSFDGEQIELVSPRAFAPGSPCNLVVALDPPLSMQVKCHGSKRTEEAAFRVRGRVIALRRDDRERLRAALV